MLFLLDIRNCYAHSLWHDANAGYLAFVNLEELATTSTIVTDLIGLTVKYLDMPILTAQEDYLDFVDHSIQYLNYEGRLRRGDLSSNPVPVPAPAARARPPLCREHDMGLIVGRVSKFLVSATWRRGRLLE